MQLTANRVPARRVFMRHDQPGIKQKLLRVMKLTAILLLTACLCASAHGLSQPVTLRLKNVPVQQVFRAIIRQADVSIVYQEALLKDMPPVSIDVKNATVEEVLQLILQKSSLLYRVEGNSIIIQQKPPDASSSPVKAAPDPVKIKVVDSLGTPLAGATVRLKNRNLSAVTNADGVVDLNVNEGDVVLISYVGYEAHVLLISSSVLSAPNHLVIALKPSVSELETVEVSVNTGYQQIPKERITGSFEVVNREKLNRQAGTDIISRLEGVATGIYFDKRGATTSQNVLPLYNVMIRGLSTLDGLMKSPLIVVNNLPYDGDIQNINPNDVENITILRDAAAASIYGARSANGVIVITTRQGRYSQPARLTINSNITIVEKPDLFAYPQMSSADFIGVETYLYKQGFYAGDLSDPNYPALSPVIEILNKRSQGMITAADSAQQIDALKNTDVRNDFTRYIYRRSVNQQYSFTLTGGAQKIRYALSGGFDKNIEGLVGNDLQRITLRSENVYSPVKNLELQLGMVFTSNSSDQNSLGNIGSYNYKFGNGYGKQLSPYAQLADANGNALAIAHDYRSGYTDTAGGGKLLDWNYRPLDEINNSDKTARLNDYVINTAMSYRLTPFLSVQGNFQYEIAKSSFRNLYSEDAYYTRNLVNLFSQVSPSSVFYAVPKGKILNESVDEMRSQIARGQVNFNKGWKDQQLTAIAGTEIREKVQTGHNTVLYGFSDTYTYVPVDYVNTYPLYGGRGSARVQGASNPYKRTDHYVSFFGNASYTYHTRYTLSASMRKDASNLLGVNINDKWKPFWTIGAAWNVTNEAFFNSRQISTLRLRGSYGYLGNVNNSLAPYTIISNGSGSNFFNQSYAVISVPANPGLSWETVRNINIGLDFAIWQSRVSGSVDVYSKKSDNLIYGSSIDATTGVESLQRNSASMTGKGVDISLNTVNIRSPFEWTTGFGVSVNRNKVVDYLLKDNFLRAGSVVAGSGISITPRRGAAPYALYSYRFAGLDPATGSPQGYLNKQVSTDYLAMQNELFDTADLVYHGSAIPTVYGFLNNTFSYKGIALTVNVSYNLGYYFKKNTISYSALYNSGITHPDFAKRWQQPGDEDRTTVPSMLYPVTNSYRDDFYANSSANILKGDHIRLQYIRLSYTPGKDLLRKWPVQTIQVYAVVNNLGILWRANKEGLDPQFDNGNGAFPPPRSVTIGLKLDF